MTRRAGRDLASTASVVVTVERPGGETASYVRPRFLAEWTGSLMSPYFVGLVWVFGAALSWFAAGRVEQREDAAIMRQTEAATGSLSAMVAGEVQRRGMALARFAGATRGLSEAQEQWVQVAGIVRETAGIDGLGWLRDVASGDSWIGVAGEAGVQDLPAEVARSFALKHRWRRAGYSAPYWTVVARDSLWLGAPAHARDASEATLVATVGLESLLAQVAAVAASNDFGVEVFDEEGRMLLMAPAIGTDTARWAARGEATVGVDRWVVQLTPTPARLHRERRDMSGLALMLGLFVTTMLSALVRAVQVALASVDEAQRAGDLLRASEHEVRLLNRDLEARVFERTEALARSNRDLEQFAYVASHDLQEPLRMVISYLQLLERRYGSSLDGQGHEFLQYAVDGGKRMRDMIRGLLRYARLGRDAVTRRPVSLEAAVASACANLEVALADAGATVDRLPLPLIDGDEALLVQLFQNLLANALKYSEQVPHIVVRAEERAPGWWTVTVADNGIGIPPEQAERAFELFQRLHGRDKYEGTGIGLAICKRIVELHGGTIGVGPPPADGGTVIEVTLPETAAYATAPRSAAAKAVQVG